MFVESQKYLRYLWSHKSIFDVCGVTKVSSIFEESQKYLLYLRSHIGITTLDFVVPAVSSLSFKVLAEDLH